MLRGLDEVDDAGPARWEGSGLGIASFLTMRITIESDWIGPLELPKHRNQAHVVSSRDTTSSPSFPSMPETAARALVTLVGYAVASAAAAVVVVGSELLCMTS